MQLTCLHCHITFEGTPTGGTVRCPNCHKEFRLTQYRPPAHRSAVPKTVPKRKPVPKNTGLYVGFLLVTGIGLAVWFRMRQEQQPAGAKKSNKAVVVAPAEAPKAAVKRVALALPTEAPQRITWATAEATTFRVFSPDAKAAFVVLYDAPTGGAGRDEKPMARGADGLWELKVTGKLEGKFYNFRLEGPDLDSKREVLDPTAVNDVFNGTRARITVMPPPPPPGPEVSSTDMVIYEIHVRDFTISHNSGAAERGTYVGFVEPGTRLPGDPQIKTGIDHLSELGVTHVQIMPVQDYENDEASDKYSWGYSTIGFFSPEGRYASNSSDDSRVREFQALVAALHERGIGVILDVAYNHTSNHSPPLQMVAPGFYYRHLPNGSLANGTHCGNEIRSEGKMVRRFILDSMRHWVTNYGVDGFRFDLMALTDRETLRTGISEMRAIHPGLEIYGEPWALDDSPLPKAEQTDKSAMREMPVGSFNDDYRNALKGMPNGPEPGFIQNGSNRDALKKALLISDWYASADQGLNYMTCHDDLVLWDKLKLSMPGASDAQMIETMKLGYLAVLTSQGVPYIHGGEEFGRSKGGNNNSYNAPDSVNRIDWELKKKNFGLFSFVRDVIAMRKAHPLFRMRKTEDVRSRLKFENAASATLVYTIDGSGIEGETWKRACVILNANGNALDVSPPRGTWSFAIDAKGAASGDAGLKINVPGHSGCVLFEM